MRVCVLGRPAAGSVGEAMLPVLAAALADAGFEPVLPFDGAPLGADGRRLAIARMAGCEGVALPWWWRECDGAAAELRVARAIEATGLLRVREWDGWLDEGLGWQAMARAALGLLGQKVRSDNTSGIKGVSFDKRRGKWCAYITVRGKTRALGRFGTLAEAAEARREAEQDLFDPILEAAGRAPTSEEAYESRLREAVGTEGRGAV